MAQEIYRRKQAGGTDESRPVDAPTGQHPLGKIPPPPQLPQAETDLPAPAAATPPPASDPTPVVERPAVNPAPLPPSAADAVALELPAAFRTGEEPNTTTARAETLEQPPVRARSGNASQLSDQQWQQQIDQLVETVSISDGRFEHRFRCETPLERARAKSLMTKEEGTVAWIEANVQAGDVFYDIGANIGLYSLPAARRVGSEGTVYAFEPHVANVRVLLNNVAENELDTRVKVISTPLSDVEGFEQFHYQSAAGGSAMSQFGRRRDVSEKPFVPCFSEWKFGTTVDSLIQAGAIRPANVIKIDVDGNELNVLQGMTGLLASSSPRSVQVEIHHRGRLEIVELMQSLGYQLVDRHYTANGKRHLAVGGDPEAIPYLAIFGR